MAKVSIKIKEDALLKIEKMLRKKRKIAAERIDAWRKRNAKALKNWKGVEIIRSFREKR